MSAFTGVDSSESSNEEETVPDTPAAYNSDKKYALYDPGNIADIKLLSDYFFGAQFVKVSDTGELEKMLEDETADAGFAVKSQTEYEYYVFNKTMYDSDSEVFNEAMKAMSRARYCEQHGLDLSEITQMYDPPITVTEHILNKNTTQSYWYCYALVIIVFMLIMFYGQMIAGFGNNRKEQPRNRGACDLHNAQQSALRQGNCRRYRRSFAKRHNTGYDTCIIQV